ncbi:MAG: hypothetical protein OEY33_03770 [Bdellovibrionales bacterium]|nr:hypothetical protein [Bdellovibrionales bacterium]
MDVIWPWIQSNLLSFVAVFTTLILLYHYLIEKGTGVRLSKRYRSSIFETQSKIFLNATQYLISGNKDLAIKEFLNAVDLNRETIDTYFALGGLFRSNGEIEKAISIHRSLIARENINETTRVRALRELALDFDKGGFIDKAIETYQDVLKINRDQEEVILALCRIYEDIEDWESAHKYRMMLSKVGKKNQAETISHILVQKAKAFFETGNFKKATEELEEAFRFAPSVSAKILRLKLFIIKGSLEEAKSLFLELLREHPMYAAFIFVSLDEKFKAEQKIVDEYKQRLSHLRDYFLKIEGDDFLNSPAVILSKVRLLKDLKKPQDAFGILKRWMEGHHSSSEILKIEYIKLLIDLGDTKAAVNETQSLLENLHQSLTRHYCNECGFNSDNIFWRCPQCHEWETIQFRWKV